MERPIRVLTTIPHLGAGGSLTTLGSALRLWPADGPPVEHRVLSLDLALPAPVRLALRGAGAAGVAGWSAATEADWTAWADVLLLVHWNTPDSLAFLERAPPAMPLVAWTMVAGSYPPQTLPPSLIRRADRIVATCAASLAAWPISDDPAARARTTVIRGIPDPSRFEPPPRTPHRGFVVTYVGTVGPGKMHPGFVDLSLSSGIEDARYLVCGAGGGENTLRASVAARGAADRFELRGYVRDVPAVLAGSDVFGYPLAPQTYATSCLSVQEAMLAGVPPVVLPHGGTAELIRDGETGLVVEEGRYGAALAHLRHAPGERDRLGRNAAAAAAADLDGRCSARRLRDVIVAAARCNRGPAVAPAIGDDPFPAARRYADALGRWGEPFRRSLAGDRSAEPAIAAQPRTWAQIEGGLFHHRNRAPEDGYLRFWSSLILSASGDDRRAAAERAAAAALGAPR